MSKTKTSATAEMLELLKALTADMADMKVAMKALQEENTSAGVRGEEMYKVLNAKFDIFKNLEAQSREISQQTTTTTRKLTRPAFFKRIFIDEREKYMNVLFTQEEIDEAFQDKDVIAKKKDTDKTNEVAGIIFTKHIKANNPEGRWRAFCDLYD